MTTPGKNNQDLRRVTAGIGQLTCLILIIIKNWVSVLGDDSAQKANLLVPHQRPKRSYSTITFIILSVPRKNPTRRPGYRTQQKGMISQIKI